MQKPYSVRGSFFVKCARAFSAVCLLGASTLASAGFITFDEAVMDSIFSQQAFGSTPIDIRFNAGRTVFDSSLLTIDNANFNRLFGVAAYSSVPTVNMFFIDSIAQCGDASGSGIAGCAVAPGNIAVLQSSVAAAVTLGGVLAAHELGHNLGLVDHVSGGNNLMNGVLQSSFMVLTSSQAQQILMSPFIQTDSATQQLYLSITPIAIVASVPEPQTWLMMVVGILGITAWMRRRGVRPESLPAT